MTNSTLIAKVQRWPEALRAYAELHAEHPARFIALLEAAALIEKAVAALTLPDTPAGEQEGRVDLEAVEAILGLAKYGACAERAFNADLLVVRHIPALIAEVRALREREQRLHEEFGTAEEALLHRAEKAEAELAALRAALAVKCEKLYAGGFSTISDIPDRVRVRASFLYALLEVCDPDGWAGAQPPLPPSAERAEAAAAELTAEVGRTGAELISERLLRQQAEARAEAMRKALELVASCECDTYMANGSVCLNDLLCRTCIARAALNPQTLSEEAAEVAASTQLL